MNPLPARILAHLQASGATLQQIVRAMGPNVTEAEVADALTLLVGAYKLSIKDGRYSVRATV